MPIPKRIRFPSTSPGLDWVETDDGSRTLNQVALDETYHSGCGAVSETLVVYLDLSDVAVALQSGRPVRVLEYGLGTGTALLLTATLAELYQTPLQYCALENWNVGGALVRQLQLAGHLTASDGPAIAAWQTPPNWIRAGAGSDSEHLFSQAAELVDALTGQLADVLDVASTEGDLAEPNVASERWTLARLGNVTQVSIRWGDAATYSLPLGQRPFDAVYFDPFSPESCPELWCSDVYRRAYESLSEGGCLVSYCVKSQVRRELSEAGFVTQRFPGPRDGKREVLKAIRPSSDQAARG